MERTVRHLDNDVQSIYGLLGALTAGVKKVQAAQLRQGSRLDQVEDRLTGVDGKLDTALDLLRRDRPTEG
ncbi:MAG: hypothetical protein GEV09_16770 [Pseudonocardiaceae bacterium]|nr:hypothetical protein [Pseudonocardiaceae bacterium]